MEAALIRAPGSARAALQGVRIQHDSLAAPEHETEIFEGRVFGSLTFPPRGNKGFGYDPIFMPEGGRFTFGEMHPDAKHAISHRAKAFAKFADAVLT